MFRRPRCLPCDLSMNHCTITPGATQGCAQYSPCGALLFILQPLRRALYHPEATGSSRGASSLRPLSASPHHCFIHGILVPGGYRRHLFRICSDPPPPRNAKKLAGCVYVAGVGGGGGGGVSDCKKRDDPLIKKNKSNTSRKNTVVVEIKNSERQQRFGSNSKTHKTTQDNGWHGEAMAA
jgi:hypothetical protein